MSTLPAMKKEDLESLQLVDLRKIARDMYNGADKTKIAFMKKPECIEFIVSMTEGNFEMPEIKAENTEGYKHFAPARFAERLAAKQDDDLADIIAKAISSRIKPELDEARVRDMITESSPKITQDAIAQIMRAIEPLLPKMQEIAVTRLDGTRVEVGVAHKMFQKVLSIVAIRKNPFLVGPSGSGKTHLCKQVADALGIPFSFEAVGMQTTKTDLLGYMNAQGTYVPSNLRKAYENGGLHLLDEADAANPNVFTLLNALLENGMGAFPDGMVKRHPDFVCVAAGNTYGHGGDIVYVGRNKLDGSTLQRFVKLDIDYDEELEEALCANKDWLKTVRSVRNAVAKLKEKVIVSPRATYTGAQLLEIGFTEDEALEALVYQGVNADIKNRIENERVR